MSSLLSAPVALEREVLPKSLLRTNLNGQDLVLWRDNANDIQVWADRCPHRSVKLSAGRNNGNCVQCPLPRLVFWQKRCRYTYTGAGSRRHLGY